MAKSIVLAWTNPVDEASDKEFNAWYSGTHVPQVMAHVPGVTGARRYRVVDLPGAGGPRPPLPVRLGNRHQRCGQRRGRPAGRVRGRQARHDPGHGRHGQPARSPVVRGGRGIAVLSLQRDDTRCPAERRPVGGLRLRPQVVSSLAICHSQSYICSSEMRWTRSTRLQRSTARS